MMRQILRSGTVLAKLSRADHYDLLPAGRQEGRCEPWSTYFLNAVIRQCENVLARAERVLYFGKQKD